MSRIGLKPITVPAGVEISVAEGNVVTVKGPKGTLTKTFSPMLKIEVENNEIKVARPDDEQLTKSLHGLTRTLVHNMVEGVVNGYQKLLIIEGTGSR